MVDRIKPGRTHMISQGMIGGEVRSKRVKGGYGEASPGVRKVVTDKGTTGASANRNAKPKAKSGSSLVKKMGKIAKTAKANEKNARNFKAGNQDNPKNLYDRSARPHGAPGAAGATRGERSVSAKKGNMGVHKNAATGTTTMVHRPTPTSDYTLSKAISSTDGKKSSPVNANKKPSLTGRLKKRVGMKPNVSKLGGGGLDLRATIKKNPLLF